MAILNGLTARRSRARLSKLLAQSTRPVVEALEDRRLLTVTFAGVADISIIEGGTLGLDGVTFSDPGHSVDHRLKVNWGDGTTAVTGTVEPDWDGATDFTVFRTHKYAAPGQYAVTLTAWDPATPTDTTIATLTAGVTAVPPVV